MNLVVPEHLQGLMRALSSSSSSPKQILQLFTPYGIITDLALSLPLGNAIGEDTANISDYSFISC